MKWSTSELLTRFDKPENNGVVRYLNTEHPSAHSDCADELHRASHDIPNRMTFCPHPQAYAYVFLHTPHNIIYALAVGMKTLAFRLPAKLKTEALSHGGIIFHEIDDEWVSFDAFQPDVPLTKSREAMTLWCGHAYDFALSQST